MANDTRKINFSAFQIDIHFLLKNAKGESDAITWSGDFIQRLFQHISSINKLDRKMNVKDQWFLVLEDIKWDDKYVYGYFKSAEYGRKRKLIHVDTLNTRDNPKDKREGEEDYTHFLIRKSDGFMLLQGHIKLTRARVDEYIEKYAGNFIKKNNYEYINICSLVGLELIDELKKLDKIKSTVIEVSAKEKSHENEFIQEIQEEIDNVYATHVTLDFKAKYQRGGLGKMIPFIQKYKGQKGITSIKIVGDQDGAERRINVDSYSERYGKEVKVDGDNNPMSENVYEHLQKIGAKRDKLVRGS